VNGITAVYVGQHYEVKNSIVTKYYFAGATRLAVRTGGTLSYLLGDHLGSSSVTTNASGVKTASALYKAFGETRFSSGALGTDYKFTGQREQAELGLYFYGARWYDGSLGRFTSPDTMIPLSQGTQAFDRYAYVNNNPVRYNDPSGHDVQCTDEGCYETDDGVSDWGRGCELSQCGVSYWKAAIKGDFGIKMSNDGGKTWDLRNLITMYYSLQNINTTLNGKLKSIIGSATFMMGEYVPTSDCPLCTYGGWTSGTSITFYTMGNAPIHQMNIYHEFGHVLDNLPGMINVFSTNSNINSPDFITATGYLNTNALASTSNNAIQHPYSILADPTIGAQEHWADIFANYVAGNIDLSKPNGPGIAMYNFVTGALAPYIGVP